MQPWMINLKSALMIHQTQTFKKNYIRRCECGHGHIHRKECGRAENDYFKFVFELTKDLNSLEVKRLKFHTTDPPNEYKRDIVGRKRKICWRTRMDRAIPRQCMVRRIV